MAKPHRQLCRSPCLDRPSFSQSSTAHDLRTDDGANAAAAAASPPVGARHHAGERDYQSKMEFALKLGYSGVQVDTVLHKLGAAALINDVLAELVRLGNAPEPEAKAGGAGTARAAAGPRAPCVTEAPSPEVSLEEEPCETCENLRPIVVDGSNVAMR